MKLKHIQGEVKVQLKESKVQYRKKVEWKL